jgi:NADPH-dependent 2,4-dienoyl-CoA reductase/sulfur reductase-like enzyme
VTLTRRRFAQAAGAAGLALGGAPALLKAATGRVVVIGGGAGGATVAKYLARDSEGALAVSLIDSQPKHTTCFYSNLYLGGYRTYESITHDYEHLRSRYGIEVVIDTALEVDPVGKQVKLAGGGTLAYDRLVVSPGIDLVLDSIEGYDEAAIEVMPHAWQAGPQTRKLREQIEGMERGGLFLLAAPPNPYRCPPGPYERVCSIAQQFRQRNPSAKILVLDAKDEFSKQSLFQAGWEEYYSGMIEWVPAEFGGTVTAVDARAMTVRAGDQAHRVAAANIIPRQRAGKIAQQAGLTDASGWCPIVPASMKSRFDQNVYVVGDACDAGDMPKSAYSANSQAKLCAMAIRAELTGSKLFSPRLRNTCWSTLAPNDAIKIGAHYEATEDKIVKKETFISAADENAQQRAQARTEADSWYEGITADIFG